MIETKDNLDTFILSIKNNATRSSGPYIKKNCSSILDSLVSVNCSYKEKLFLYKNNLDSIPVCKKCSGEVKFHNINSGYDTYCSIKCSSNCVSSREKRKNTILDVYGVENVFQSKSTNLDRYRDETPQRTSEIKEKVKATCLNRYGVVAGNCYGSEMYKDNLMKIYGVDNVFKSEKIKEKIKNSLLKNFGVEHPAQSEEIRSKMRKTTLDRYGVEHIMQLEEYRGKNLQEKYSLKSYNSIFGAINHQSNLELDFIKFCEKENIFLKNCPSIEYEFENKRKVYFVDFETEKSLIEIKGRHMWYEKDLASGKLEAKETSAKNWCSVHNKKFLFLLEEKNYELIKEVI